jgi:hypothetical protein
LWFIIPLIFSLHIIVSMVRLVRIIDFMIKADSERSKRRGTVLAWVKVGR